MTASTSPPARLRVQIAFLDVGQGDTAIVWLPDLEERDAFVIDCVNAEAVRAYLVQQQIRRLRAIIATHLHADHYSGVLELLVCYEDIPDMHRDTKLFCNLLDGTPRRRKRVHAGDLDHHDEAYAPPPLRQEAGLRDLYTDLEDWCDAHPTMNANLVLQGTHVWSGLPMGPLADQITVLHPFRTSRSTLLLGGHQHGLNNTSISLLVRGPGSSALLLGDLEPLGWQRLRAHRQHLGLDSFKSDLLKFPHHGGAWPPNDVAQLLAEVDPSVVVISVGTAGHRYGHPTSVVLEAIKELRRQHPVRILCTQGTELCRPSGVTQQQTISVVDYINANTPPSYPQNSSTRGCPCAGHVTVDLGDDLKILHPSLGLHQSVIAAHFPDPQCVGVPVSTP